MMRVYVRSLGAQRKVLSDTDGGAGGEESLP